MNKRIKITKENYKDYIKLYKKKDEIDKSAERLENILKIIEFLVYFLGLGTVVVVANIVSFSLISIGIFFLSLVIYMRVQTTLTREFKALYQHFKNGKLEEEFPNIDTKIDTEELVEKLIMERLISKTFIRSGRYRKKEKCTITVREEEFLKYQNSLEKVKEQKEKGEKRKRLLINKYNEIKKQMLEEYPSDYSKLDYNTSISAEELEKVKGQVKKLVKSRQQ